VELVHDQDGAVDVRHNQAMAETGSLERAAERLVKV